MPAGNSVYFQPSSNQFPPAHIGGIPIPRRAFTGVKKYHLAGINLWNILFGSYVVVLVGVVKLVRHRAIKRGIQLVDDFPYSPPNYLLPNVFGLLKNIKCFLFRFKLQKIVCLKLYSLHKPAKKPFVW